MMDKDEFTNLYASWFAMHPFKKRDWPELGKVHFEAFGRENQTMMREALGMLIEEFDGWPSPKQIRTKLNFLSAKRTEDGPRIKDTAANEEIASRLLEHRLGVQYNGEKVKRPAGVQAWHEAIVNDVINSGLPDHHMAGAYSEVGLRVVRNQSNG